MVVVIAEFGICQQATNVWVAEFFGRKEQLEMRNGFWTLLGLQVIVFLLLTAKFEVFAPTSWPWVCSCISSSP